MTLNSYKENSIRDSLDVFGEKIITDIPVIHYDSGSSEGYMDLLNLQYGTGNVIVMNQFQVNSLVTAFSSNFHSAYDKLGLVNNGPLVRRYRLNFSFDNFFEWGSREKTEEIPNIVQFYLSLLNIQTRYKYDPILTDSLLSKLIYIRFCIYLYLFFHGYDLPYFT